MPERGVGMKLRNMVLCALFTALLCICAWIGIPLADQYITLQTFALLLALELLGGKLGSLVCLLYLLLGAVGLPVFSGFRGGIGMLLGPTGGYLWGFLAGALVYWLLTALLGNRFGIRLLGCILCCLSCYACGSLWYSVMYLKSGLWAALLTGVVPYLLPDGIKLALALVLGQKLRRFV